MRATKYAFVLVLSLALSVALAGAVSANNAKDATSAGAKPPLSLGDVALWKSIRSAQLSDDGAWFAYALVPGEGDAQVVVRSTADERELRFDIGEPPRMSRQALVELSESSRYLVFRRYPTAAENRKKRGSSGRGGTNRPNGPDAERGQRITLVDLASIERAADREQPSEEADEGETSEESAGEGDWVADTVDFDEVRGFAFSGESSAWLAVHKVAPSGSSTRSARSGRPGTDGDDQPPKRPKGSDLLLRELETSQTWNVGNVAEMAFSDSGRFLAVAIEAEDRTSNGIQLRDLEAGTVELLDGGEATYRALSWLEDHPALALLRGHENDAYEEEEHVLLAFRGLGTETVFDVEYDPREDESFPEGFAISSDRRPQWHESYDVVSFGIAEPEPAEDRDGKGEVKGKKSAEDGVAEGDDVEDTEDADSDDATEGRGRSQGKKSEVESADLVIWHWQDERLQSQQQVEERRDETHTFLAAYRPTDQRFLRLADDDLRNVSLEPDDRYALGIDRERYQLDGNLEGRRYVDVWTVDPLSGERNLAVEKVRWNFGIDPKGERVLYYRDGHFHSYDIAAGRSRNLTEAVPTSFVNTEDDHNVVDPPVRPAGWTEAGDAVILSDNWDLWKVPVDGSEAVRLTPDGPEKQLRYGRGFGGVMRLDPEDEGIDLSEPAYFSVYGEWTKKAGLARLDPGKKRVKTLMMDDARFGRMAKAENADVYVHTRETVTDFPNYFVTDAGLDHARQLTDANPQQAEVAWSSGSRLIDYESAHGDKLQAALFLPADYREGQKYPTIVYIYERLSQGKNGYGQPTAYSFDRSTYTSHGYAVLTPDITYRVNDPGMSAVWSVLPALEAAIETGIVDPDRVGLQGHSWGGYQTSFLITQTDAFAAAVAGAPLTNMISMYSSIYWNTGSANQPIFESSQGRFEGDYLDHLDAYARNSPVYHAKHVNTPFVILHNDKDGAVDWNQGIEYFNTLRRLRKPVVMLQYKGENHGLRKPANRQDYYVRMKEFFDHQLKGAEAPDWWAAGVSHLDLEEHLEQRAEAEDELKRKVREAGKKDEKMPEGSEEPVTSEAGSEPPALRH